MSEKDFRPTQKYMLLLNAPDDKMKEFIKELSTVETENKYRIIRNKKEYKDIFEQYPEFTGDWAYDYVDKNGNTKPTTTKYNYKLVLNRKTKNINPGKNETGKLYNILKKFAGSPQDFHVSEYNNQINNYMKRKEQEYQQERDEKIKQQGAKKKEEEKNEEIEQIKQQKEEEKRKIKEESNKDLNEKVAQTKHKTEERTKKELEEQLEEANKNNVNIINTRLKDYVRDKYIIDSPQTRERLFKKVARDPILNAKTEEDINKYVDYILGKQLQRIITSKTKIIKTAKLFGNDAEYLSKLDPTVRELVLKYQTDLINKTITDKNNKYLLPKKYIKFEKAINNYKVNPLILRGLYVK